MWVEILLCGLVIYILVRPCLADDHLDIETPDSNDIFSVANRLEKLYGGKVFVGLRIPDPETASLQSIDMILLTKGGAVLISVKNLAGFVSFNGDGSWACETKSYPDPVEEAKRQVSVLQSYLEQRGVPLPEGFLSYKIIIPNPKFLSTETKYPTDFPTEVITYDQWLQMKPETVQMKPETVQMKPEIKNNLSGWNWIKNALLGGGGGGGGSNSGGGGGGSGGGGGGGGKKEMEESLLQKANFILSTAPMWDRLELKGSRYVLGEFVEFNGKRDDTLALKSIERSKVYHVIVQKTSKLGLAPSMLQVLYSSRDYRSEGASSSDWTEKIVRSSTVILFKPENTTTIRKVTLSSVVSLSLSG